MLLNSLVGLYDMSKYINFYFKQKIVGKLEESMIILLIIDFFDIYYRK